MLKNSLIILLVFVIFGCAQPKTSDTQTDDAIEVADAKANFVIEGMSCQSGCASAINKALREMSGIVSSEVDFESKTAVVSYDNSLVSEYAMMDIINTLKDSAYEVSSVEVEIIKEVEKNKIDTH